MPIVSCLLYYVFIFLSIVDKESDRKYYFGAPPAKKRSSKVKDSIPTGSKMWNVNVAGGSKWRQVLEIPPTYTDKEFEKLNQVYLNELAGKKWDVVLPLLTQDDLQGILISFIGANIRFYFNNFVL